MASAELIETTGTVADIEPGGTFRVDIGAGICRCKPSGKLRVNNIKILRGDKVTVQLSPYDPSKGRIVWRLRE